MNRPRTFAISVSIPLLVAALALAGLAPRSEREDRGGRKASTGRNYAAQTDVQALPRPSRRTVGFDEERVWPGLDDWEPAVAADRHAPWVYQATTRYGSSATCPTCPDPGISVRVSSDAGSTWSFERFLPGLEGAPTQYDPELATSDDGTVFAAWLQGENIRVVFSKSTDHGTTWSPAHLVHGREIDWSDKPAMAVSPDGNDVYIGFNWSDAYVVVSHDGGATFGSPIKTSPNDGRYWFHYQGAAAGEFAWFATSDYSQNYKGLINVSVVWTSNRGKTWTTTRLDTSQEAPPCDWVPGCYFGFLGSASGIAVDSSGAVLFAYNVSDVGGGPQHLFTRKSADGVNFEERVEIGETSAETDHGFPAVAAGPQPGNFRVVWQDDRLAPAAAFNTWLSQTADGGTTWGADVRLSDRSDGAPYKSSGGFGFPYGDYLCVAVDGDGRTHAIWGEGTSYNGPGGTWSTRGRIETDSRRPVE